MTYFEGTIAPPALMTFNKDGRTAHIDIVDGEIIYGGDVNVSEDAKALFAAMIPYINDEYLARAASKPTGGKG